MLVAGAVTFVVSVSVAVSLEITPKRGAGPPNRARPPQSSPETPAAVQQTLPPAIPVPLAIA